jgi:hypothetical protein
MEEAAVFWTEYMQYRLSLRGFDLAAVEYILRYSSERYLDTVTGRLVAVGRHEKLLVIIPYELKGNNISPVTIHTTSRQQINSRVRSGRFRNE